MTTDAPIGILLSEVEPREVRWLWPGRVPLGKLTIVDGDPGLGKSTAALDLAALVTLGAELPDSTVRAPKGGVVVLTAEDDLADTVVPRLEAAGADLERVLAIRVVPDGKGEERPPSLPEDVEHIRSAIEKMDARLVIIDPIMAYLNAATDAHKDSSVRRVLHRLATVAEDTETAFLLIRHLNKMAGGSPLYRGGGSIAFIGAARSGLLVARDPDDPQGRVLATTKCNLAVEPESLAFHLESADHAVARVVWDGVSRHDAAGLLAEPVDDDERTARTDAKEFIKTVLRGGPVAAREVERQAREAGIAKATLGRAKKELHVESFQSGFHSGWTWRLPQNIKNPSRKSEVLRLCVPEENCHTASGNQDITPQSDSLCDQGTEDEVPK